MKTYTLNIDFLCPVHVGTGEDLDPFHFVIDGNDLVLVDMERWLIDESDNKEMLDRFMNLDFLELRNFVAKTIPVDRYGKARISVKSHRLMSEYKNAIMQRSPLNQVLLNLLPRSLGFGTPYIPGSSIKGAIRTAIGSYLASQARVTKADKIRDYNRKIFGEIREDPFKYVKVSDARLSGLRTSIVSGDEVSKNKNRKTGLPKGHFEVTPCIAWAESTYSVKAKFMWKDLDFRLGSSSEVITLDMLIDKLNAFYIPKYFKELNDFYSLPHLNTVKHRLNKVTSIVDEIKQNKLNRCALMRIGHFSHLECMTFDGLRNPRGKYGTTRTLANREIPFGWVKISLDPGYNPLEQDSVRYYSSPKENAPGKISPEKSAEQIMEDRLHSLTMQLDGMLADKMPGMLPQIARDILKSEDDTYREKASRMVLEYIEKRGMRKKFKAKDWYKELTNTGQ